MPRPAERPIGSHRLGLKLRVSHTLFVLLYLGAIGGSLYASKLAGLDTEVQAFALLCLVGLSAWLMQTRPWAGSRLLAARGGPFLAFALSTVLVTAAVHPERLSAFLIAYMIVGGLFVIVLAYFIFTDRRLFDAVILVHIWAGVLLVPPAILGALGADSFLGLAIKTKEGYARFSSVAASAGVIDFPATFGTQLAIAMVACVYWLVRHPRSAPYWTAFGILALGLIIAQARGAFLGLAGAAALVFLARRIQIPAWMLLTAAIAVILAPLFATELIAMIPGVNSYFRVEAGLAGRAGGWIFALRQIAAEPLAGHGFGASSELTTTHIETLRQVRFRAEGASFHNTFISRAVEFGVPNALLYLAIYVIAFLRTARAASHSLEARFLMAMVLVCTTASVYKDINIGGLRSISVSTALFVGLALSFVTVRARAPRRSYRPPGAATLPS